MSRRRKILIILIGLAVLSQLPFAYRRYRLHRLNNAIQQLATQRTLPAGDDGFVDYKGVIHVHTSLGGHSTGTFTELIAAAKANGLTFVIMAEHPQPNFDTAAFTLTGVHDGVLFISGSEVKTASGDRLLLLPGSDTANTATAKSTQEVLDEQRAKHGLAIVAYPGEFKSWQATNIDGVEVYNLFTNARSLNPAVTFFDALWSYGSDSKFMFANFFARPNNELAQWDAAIASGNRKLFATGGNDAHSNIGLSLNDASGHRLLGIDLDPYVQNFALVRTHVLMAKDKPLTRESLLEALIQGHAYLSFDLFSDPTGFNFTAQKTANHISMGDEVSFSDGLRLKATAPLPCRYALLKDGQVVDGKSGDRVAEFEIREKGVYRLEVYLESLLAPAAGKPWIISNPIYVR